MEANEQENKQAYGWTGGVQPAILMIGSAWQASYTARDVSPTRPLADIYRAQPVSNQCQVDIN